LGVPQMAGAAIPCRKRGGGERAGHRMKILIVDDDPQIREVLTIALNRAGYATLSASDGAGALRSAARDAPDLMILDVGLPELDGLEVCRRLRATSDLPVLFLTARDDEVDRILGLELGADDYVTKPFSPRELTARIKAILKRTNGTAGARPVSLEQGLIRLKPATHHCRFGDQTVALTGSEMTLLHRLMLRPDQVLTRAQLVQALYGRNSHASDRTMDSHLRNLRRKLASAGCPDAIVTLHGIGIRMGPCLGG
jgi:two-component system, OmpR family, response regulator